ncbi:hypothetical protein A3Q56_04721 [Intoshia linei]|uniref:Cystinosin n=1 Tax=Intoshia linei TaxID=1819745 RepID=A0A177AZV2_9BILA|nr:hypothetical protein A3Q56_04721 [Intoshia linei]
MNYKRKSVDGFSILNIFLDLIGGFFSLLQMFLIAFNRNNWHTLLQNITKLSLGVLSIMYDSIIVMQWFRYKQINVLVLEEENLMQESFCDSELSEE